MMCLTASLLQLSNLNGPREDGNNDILLHGSVILLDCCIVSNGLSHI